MKDIGGSEENEEQLIEDFAIPSPNIINKENFLEEEKKQIEKEESGPPAIKDERVMLYFHGNSEDVGSNVYFLM